MSDHIEIDFLNRTKAIFNELEAFNIPFFIAGGAIRDAYLYQEPKDYDLYFHNENDSRRALEALKPGQHGGKFFTDIKFAGLNVQIIHKRNFNNPKKLIYDFDFSCVCACVDHNYDFYYHDWFKSTVKDKKLVVVNITSPLSTMERVYRFAKRGYWIEKNELRQIGMAINEMDSESLKITYYQMETKENK